MARKSIVKRRQRPPSAAAEDRNHQRAGVPVLQGNPGSGRRPRRPRIATQTAAEEANTLNRQRPPSAAAEDRNSG